MKYLTRFSAAVRGPWTATERRTWPNNVTTCLGFASGVSRLALVQGPHCCSEHVPVHTRTGSVFILRGPECLSLRLFWLASSAPAPGSSCSNAPCTHTLCQCSALLIMITRRWQLGLCRLQLPVAAVRGPPVRARCPHRLRSPLQAARRHSLATTASKTH